MHSMHQHVNMSQLLRLAKHPLQEESVARVRHIPAWLFHGGKDRIVHPQISRDLYHRLGGNSRPNELKLSIFPSVGHNCWREAYCCKELFGWILKQAKGSSLAIVSSPLSPRSMEMDSSTTHSALEDRRNVVLDEPPIEPQHTRPWRAGPPQHCTHEQIVFGAKAASNTRRIGYVGCESWGANQKVRRRRLGEEEQGMHPDGGEAHADGAKHGDGTVAASGEDGQGTQKGPQLDEHEDLEKCLHCWARQLPTCLHFMVHNDELGKRRDEARSCRRKVHERSREVRLGPAGVKLDNLR